MRIRVNGEWMEVEGPLTVRQLLVQLKLPVPAQGIAVAVNDQVVPRGAWDETPLRDGDIVEIVRAVAGGFFP